MLSLVGVFVEKEAKPSEPNSYDPRQARRPGVGGVEVWCEISPLALETALAGLPVATPFVFRPGDQIQRASGAVFSVTAVYVSVSGLLRLRVNQIA